MGVARIGAAIKSQICSLSGQNQMPNRNVKPNHRDRITRKISVNIIKVLLLLRLSSKFTIFQLLSEFSTIKEYFRVIGAYEIYPDNFLIYGAFFLNISME